MANSRGQPRTTAEWFAVLQERDELKECLQKAQEHLDYCGWGDAWEREGTRPLQDRITAALQLSSEPS